MGASPAQEAPHSSVAAVKARSVVPCERCSAVDGSGMAPTITNGRWIERLDNANSPGDVCGERLELRPTGGRIIQSHTHLYIRRWRSPHRTDHCLQDSPSAGFPLRAIESIRRAQLDPASRGARLDQRTATIQGSAQVMVLQYRCRDRKVRGDV